MTFFTEFRQFIADIRELLDILNGTQPINLEVNVVLKLNDQLINPVDGTIIITPNP